MKSSYFCSLFLSLCALGSTHAAEKPVKIFILAGQSNMEGKAPNALLDHQATDAKTKDVFKACAATAETAGLQKSKDANEAALKALAANGMLVKDPSPAFAKELRAIGATMTDEWIAKAGDAGKAVINGFKK